MKEELIEFNSKKDLEYFFKNDPRALNNTFKEDYNDFISDWDRLTENKGIYILYSTYENGFGRSTKKDYLIIKDTKNLPVSIYNSKKKENTYEIW